MKYILITGATSGIGEATARYLNQCDGYQLILVARNEEKLVSLCEELGNECKYIKYDLTQMDEIENIFIQCRDWGIKLDGLVHCAGVSYDMPVRSNNMEDMIRIYQLHVFAFTELGKHFGKKKYSVDGASLVSMSSVAPSILSKGMSAYAGSKAALNVTVKILAKELLKRKIRVNAVAPAYVETSMVDYMSLDERVKSGTWIQELGIIPPEHVAYMIEYLLSEKGKYITGSIMSINAGVIL